MSNRTLRVNELIQRELSDILRKKYQSEALAITITAVQTAPDLRDGRVYVSVMGDEKNVEEKLKWLRAKAHDLRFELGRRIVLKYLPQLTYKLDETTLKGNRILHLLDELTPAGSEIPDPEPPAEPEEENS